MSLEQPHQILPPENDLIAGIMQCEKGNNLDVTLNRPEGMKGYMLLFTIFGRGQVFDGKQSFVVKRGQLLLFEPHSLQHYARQEDCQSWHYKWVYFYPKPIWLKWLNWTNKQQGIGQILIEDPQYFHEISQLFSQIEWEAKSQNPYKNEMTASLLEYLLMKCISAEQRHIHTIVDSRILTVCDIITRDLTQNSSVAELAAQVYLSESRLSHLFKQSLGISLLQWREQQRITEAKKLLYFSNLSIHKIAKSLGYEDTLYFSKIFKKHTALSPTQFRHKEQGQPN